jgi:opacity protein-like surface antigen
MEKFYRIFLLMAILIPAGVRGQTRDCEQTIAYATEEFNAGHFYSIPALLNECLKSFSREQKQRAFLLLTQTYLLLDDPIGAERSFLEILTANPEFVADEQLHSIDIVYLSKRFTATPKFSWFVGGGSNVSPMRLILDMDVAKDQNEKYSLRPGYNFGAGGEYSYSDNIKLRAEVNYLHTSYSTHAKGYNGSDEKTFVDAQNWINVPLYVSYSDNIGTYRPYVYAGYSFSGLFGDNGSITLRNIDGAGTEDMDIFERQSPDFDFTERRNKLNQSLIFGGGLKYKVGLDFVFAEVRYSVGLRNIVNTDKIYGNHTYDQTSAQWVVSLEPASAFSHVDDYIRLDNLAITFGFLRPLYKPRELKRVRTKGVLRKIKRS